MRKQIDVEKLKAEIKTQIIRETQNLLEISDDDLRRHVEGRVAGMDMVIFLIDLMVNMGEATLS